MGLRAQVEEVGKVCQAEHIGEGTHQSPGAQSLQAWWLQQTLCLSLEVTAGERSPKAGKESGLLERAWSSCFGSVAATWKPVF